jgi:hypothetical protein
VSDIEDYKIAFAGRITQDHSDHRENLRTTLLDAIIRKAWAIYTLHLKHVYLGDPSPSWYQFEKEFSNLEPKDLLDKLRVVPLAIEISVHLKTFETIINSDGDPKKLKETIEAITTNLRKIQQIFPSFTQGINRQFLTECLGKATECSALIDTFISEEFSFGENNEKIQKSEIDILAHLRQNLKSSISGVFIFQERIPKYFGANGTAETLAEIRALDFPSEGQAGQRFDPNLREKEQKYIELANQIVSIWQSIEPPSNGEKDDSTPNISWPELQTKLEEIFVKLNAMAGQDILGDHFVSVNNTHLQIKREELSKLINLLTVFNALDDSKTLEIPEISLEDEVVVVEPSPETTPATDTALEEKSSPAPVPLPGDPVWAFLVPSCVSEKT